MRCREGDNRAILDEHSACTACSSQERRRRMRALLSPSLPYPPPKPKGLTLPNAFEVFSGRWVGSRLIGERVESEGGGLGPRARLHRGLGRRCRGAPRIRSEF